MVHYLRLALWCSAAVGLCLRGAQAECYGAEVPFGSDRYSFFYEAGFRPPTGCPRANVTVSRLFLEGSCVSTRDNNFGSKLPDCSGQGGAVTSNSTCAAVFAGGPKSSFVNLGDIGDGEWFDYGTICTTSARGYFFFQSECPSLEVRALTFATDRYGSNWCWNGRRVSRGAATGVAIACFIFIFLLFIALFYLVRRRQQLRQGAPLASTMHMPAYPQPPPPPYPGPPPSHPGPSSSSGFVQPPFSSYGDKPVTGIPVSGYRSGPSV